MTCVGGRRVVMLLWVLIAGVPAWAQRVNHAGRVLGPVPVVKEPLLFNTAAADAVVGAMQIMPRDSAWNETINARPVLAGSAAMIERIRRDLKNRNTLRVFSEMNFVLVPDGYPLKPLRITQYPAESDFNGGQPPLAQWPIPPRLPVETWPGGRPRGEALETWQRDPQNAGGDRHLIVVQPGAGKLYEAWQGRLTDNGWQASCCATFPLGSNAPRPAGWTSADAAGLPMFPGLIRYDEIQRGVIEHALRGVVRVTRREFIYPATHFASRVSPKDPEFASLPAMGQRLRLKASFSIPDGWSKGSKVVAQALKTYGVIVADNGGFFSLSATPPDDRFPANWQRDLETLPVDQFEVLVTTGPQDGPRAANAKPKAAP